MDILVPHKVLASTHIILLVIGTITNFLTVFVCMKKRLRIKSTYIFLAFIAVFDTIPFYFYALNFFTITFFRKPISDFNIFYCRASPFFYGGAQHISAWLLVIMCFERYAKVNMSIWKTVNFSGQKAFIVSSLLVALFVAAFVPILFSTEYIPSNITVSSNYTQSIFVCRKTAVFFLYTTIQLYDYTIVPFGLITIANILLVKTILFGRSKNIKRSPEQIAKRRSTSISIMIITISFIVLTLPKAIVLSFYIETVLSTTGGLIVLGCVEFLNNLYQSLSFFIFVTTNTLFQQEFKNMFSKTTKYIKNSHTKNTTT